MPGEAWVQASAGPRTDPVVAFGFVAMVAVGDWSGGKALKKGARKFHRNGLDCFRPAFAVDRPGALAIKQSPPTDRQPVLLEPPEGN